MNSKIASNRRNLSRKESILRISLWVFLSASAILAQRRGARAKATAAALHSFPRTWKSVCGISAVGRGEPGVGYDAGLGTSFRYERRFGGVRSP